jgi:hypothetical protein
MYTVAARQRNHRQRLAVVVRRCSRNRTSSSRQRRVNTRPSVINRSSTCRSRAAASIVRRRCHIKARRLSRRRRERAPCMVRTLNVVLLVSIRCSLRAFVALMFWMLFCIMIGKPKPPTHLPPELDVPQRRAVLRQLSSVRPKAVICYFHNNCFCDTFLIVRHTKGKRK